MKPLRIVGLGSPDHGDDAAGPLVAAALRDTTPPGVEVWTDTAGGVRFDAWCAGVDGLVLVDAACASPGFPAGSRRRIAWPEQRHLLQTTRLAGTHAFSIEKALQLAEILGRLPRRVTLFVLAGDHFQIGAPLSPALQEPLRHLIEQIRREIPALLRAPD
jgi:hydrogenase maturation protease